MIFLYVLIHAVSNKGHLKKDLKLYMNTLTGLITNNKVLTLYL